MQRHLQPDAVSAHGFGGVTRETIWRFFAAPGTPRLAHVHSPQSTVHSPRSTVHSPQSEAGGDGAFGRRHGNASRGRSQSGGMHRTPNASRLRRCVRVWRSPWSEPRCICSLHGSFAPRAKKPRRGGLSIEEPGDHPPSFCFFSGAGAGLPVEFPACRAAEKQEEGGSGWRRCGYKQATPSGV